MSSMNGWSFLSASFLVLLGCGGREVDVGNNKDAGGPSCPGAAQWSVLTSTTKQCSSCLLQKGACSGQVNAVQSMCSAYFGCACACAPTDASCQHACPMTAGCTSALQMVACTSTDPGCSAECRM
jgi:hypothetical protein